MKSELDDIAVFVEKLFSERCSSAFLYHNFRHTRKVVEHAEEMAKHYGLRQKECFILLTAAWFHDTGHLLGDMVSHEEAGVRLMRRYFAARSVDSEMLDIAAACIMATKMPTKPQNLLERILCDADTYHVGTAEFIQMNERVWGELELRLGISVGNRIEKSILFLKEHQFFTFYCQQELSEGKARNLAYLESLRK